MLTKLMEWNVAGLAAGLAVLALGWIGIVLARRTAHKLLRRVASGLAGLVALAGILMSLGGVIHLGYAMQAASSHPARGRVVDVGGYKMHILCEGSVTDVPAIIWMSGGRAEGLFMYHLHQQLKGVTRSCLYDRTGTGWSGVGPDQPNRLVHDVSDLAKLLHASGEDRNGPFLLVGHSAGGILAPNFAALEPKLTAGVVLLDPSAPLHDFVGRDVWCHYGPQFNARQAWRISFGLDRIFGSGLSPQEQALYQDLTDVGEDIRANLTRNPVGPWLMATSASCRDPLGMVFTPGALGDLPLMAIIQPERSKEQVNEHLRYLYPMTDFEKENYYRMVQMIEHQYVQMSSRSIFVRAPDGSSHMFPYEHRDFVVEKTREMLRIVAASGGWSLRPAEDGTTAIADRK